MRILGADPRTVSAVDQKKHAPKKGTSWTNLGDKAFCCLYFLVLTLLWASPYLVLNRVSLPGDELYQEEPWRYLVKGSELGYVPEHRTTARDVVYQTFPKDILLNKELKEHRIPLWDPYSLCGTPNVGVPTYPLYPPRLLAHYLFPPLDAHQLLVLFHLFLTGLFCSWFLLEREVSLPGALLGGTSAAFGGLAMAWLEFESPTAAIAWSVFCLYQLERLKKEERSALPWLGLGAAFVVLPGHAQFSLYGALLVAAYTLVRLREGGQRLRAAGAAVAGGCLSSSLWLPLLQLSGQSNRLTYDPAVMLAENRLSWFHLWSLLNPESLGTPESGFYVGLVQGGVANSEEFWLHLGWIPLVLACFAWRRAPFFVGSALFSALYAAGPLYYLSCWLFPQMGGQLVPSRGLAFFSLSLALLAGFGFDQWRENQELKTPTLVISGLGVAAFSWFVLSAQWPSSWLGKYRFDHTVLRKTNFVEPNFWESRWPSIFQEFYSLSNAAWWMTLGLMVTFAVLVFHRKKSFLGPTVVLLTVLELFFFSHRLHHWTPKRDIFPATPATDFLKENHGTGRVASVRTGNTPNTMTAYQLPNISGYHPLYSSRVAEFWKPVLGATKHEIYLYEWPPYCWRAMNLLSVGLVAQGTSLPDFFDRVYGPAVYRRDMHIYRNGAALPRAYVVHDWLLVDSIEKGVKDLLSREFDSHTQAVIEAPGPAPEGAAQKLTPAEFEYVSPHLVRVTVDAPQEGFLVLTDSYYEGWHCYEGTERRDIVPANVMFRGVFLEAGAHKLEFRFEPSWVGWAKGLTLLGVLLLGLLLFTTPKSQDD